MKKRQRSPQATTQMINTGVIAQKFRPWTTRQRREWILQQPKGYHVRLAKVLEDIEAEENEIVDGAESQFSELGSARNCVRWIQNQPVAIQDKLREKLRDYAQVHGTTARAQHGRNLLVPAAEYRQRPQKKVSKRVQRREARKKKQRREYQPKVSVPGLQLGILGWSLTAVYVLVVLVAAALMESTGVITAGFIVWGLFVLPRWWRRGGSNILPEGLREKNSQNGNDEPRKRRAVPGFLQSILPKRKTSNGGGLQYTIRGFLGWVWKPVLLIYIVFRGLIPLLFGGQIGLVTTLLLLIVGVYWASRQRSFYQEENGALYYMPPFMWALTHLRLKLFTQVLKIDTEGTMVNVGLFASEKPKTNAPNQVSDVDLKRPGQGVLRILGWLLGATEGAFQTGTAKGEDTFMLYIGTFRRISAENRRMMAALRGEILELGDGTGGDENGQGE